MRLQSLQGSYVLRAKLTAVVDSAIALSGTIEGDLAAAEALASYESIHPLYLQAGPPGPGLFLCSGIAGLQAAYMQGGQQQVANDALNQIANGAKVKCRQPLALLTNSAHAGQDAGVLRYGGHAGGPVGVHVLGGFHCGRAGHRGHGLHWQARQLAAWQVLSPPPGSPALLGAL